MGRKNNTAVDLGLSIMCSSHDSWGNKRERELHSLSDIARYCGCTRENIRLIERRALRKLRLRLEHDPALVEAIEHYCRTK